MGPGRIGGRGKRPQSLPLASLRASGFNGSCVLMVSKADKGVGISSDYSMYVDFVLW